MHLNYVDLWANCYTIWVLLHWRPARQLTYEQWAGTAGTLLHLM